MEPEVKREVALALTAPSSALLFNVKKLYKMG
jgi:hypothetical protein